MRLLSLTLAVLTAGVLVAVGILVWQGFEASLFLLGWLVVVAALLGFFVARDRHARGAGRRFHRLP